VRTSGDKMYTKDSCWSVVVLYDSRGLPGVSIAGVDGVLHIEINISMSPMKNI
jgi:hypothetical protein